MELLGIIYGLYCECPNCDPDEVRYVGQTADEMDTRMRSHLAPKAKELTPRYKWVHSHGSRNIRHLTLEVVAVDQLDLRERFWIAEKNTFILDNPRGKNSTRGGDLSFMSEDELEVLTRKRYLDNFNARKLDWEQVREIRRLYCETSMTVDEIASQFGVVSGTAYSVIMNVNWTDPNYIYVRRDRTGAQVGESAGGAKLTWNEVRKLRSAFCAGEKVKDIASRFGVEPLTVKTIGYAGTWPDPEYTPPSRTELTKLRARLRAEESVSPKQVAYIRESNLSGKNMGELSAETGLPLGIVRQVLSNELHPDPQGFVRRRGIRERVSTADIQKVKDLLSRGTPVAEVSRTMGIARATVRRYGEGL